MKKLIIASVLILGIGIFFFVDRAESKSQAYLRWTQVRDLHYEGGRLYSEIPEQRLHESPLAQEITKLRHKDFEYIFDFDLAIRTAGEETLFPPYHEITVSAERELELMTYAGDVIFQKNATPIDKMTAVEEAYVHRLQTLIKAAVRDTIDSHYPSRVIADRNASIRLSNELDIGIHGALDLSEQEKIDLENKYRKYFEEELQRLESESSIPNKEPTAPLATNCVFMPDNSYVTRSNSRSTTNGSYWYYARQDADDCDTYIVVNTGGADWKFIYPGNAEVRCAVNEYGGSLGAVRPNNGNNKKVIYGSRATHWLFCHADRQKLVSGSFLRR